MASEDERKLGHTHPAHQRRADIEGLRAVAVVLVLLFHAQLGAPGGFVGVDVFFVISGYLITGLLLRERTRTGTISLREFYARRIRRLLPASALVLVVTLVAALVLAPPLLVPQIGHDATAAALYVSNLSFAAQATDYFASTAAPSPILHYWSLGVEEQFYLLWPAVILVAARGSGRPARRVGVAAVAIGAASYAFATWLAGVSLPWSFFSLPSRAWELALGAVLAVGEPVLRRVAPALAALLGWAGLAMIAAAGLLLTGAAAFPGAAALLPSLGAALVIWGGMATGRWAPARWLGTTVPRQLGRFSYSIYLWHWPLLVLPALALGTVLPVAARIGLALAAIPLAAATTVLVEDPLRHGRLIGTRPRWSLAMAGVLALVVALAANGVSGAVASELGAASPAASADANANSQQLDQILDASPAASPTPGGGSSGKPTPAGSSASGPSPSATARPTAAPRPAPVTVVTAPSRGTTPDGVVPAGLQPSLGAAGGDMPLSYRDGCHTATDQPPSTSPCLYGNLASSHTIALFGDSHALSWFPALLRIAQDRGWRLLSLTMSACTPADIPAYNPSYDRTMANCTLWRRQSIAELVRTRPDILLITGTRGFATVDGNGQVLAGDLRTQFWVQGMKRTLTALLPAAGRVVLIGDLPISMQDPPVCLSAHLAHELACATPVDEAVNYDWLNTEFTVARAMGTGFIDPERWICPTSPCPAVIGNLLILRDNGHMTATFAAALWRKLEAAVALAASESTTQLIW